MLKPSRETSDDQSMDCIRKKSKDVFLNRSFHFRPALACCHKLDPSVIVVADGIYKRNLWYNYTKQKMAANCEIFV